MPADSQAFLRFGHDAGVPDAPAAVDLDIEGSTLTAATIEADMTTIVTDDERRDDNVQDALETTQFPVVSVSDSATLELQLFPTRA